MGLRFADDVVLVSQSTSDITKMITDFETFAAEYGLRINFEKTKVMTWDSLRGGSSTIKIGAATVQIVPEDTPEKYLGVKISFRSARETEFRNRVAAAWAAFHVNKGELCSKSYALKDRIRLFDAVVTPVMLYACPTWTLTSVMEKELITVRQKMLRYVFRIFRRKETETWVEYLQRSAKVVDEVAEQHLSVDWLQTYRGRKWRFAGRTVLQCDDRWSKLVMQSAVPHKGGRNRGHPRLRWADALAKYAGEDWMASASDKDLWRLLEDGFVNRFV